MKKFEDENWIALRGIDKSQGAPALWAMLIKMGYNKELTLPVIKSSRKSEDYCIFTLAACIVKCFSSFHYSEIIKRFGKGVATIYKLSHEIVKKYTLP